MSIPVKKLINGFTIPVYGIGTWQMGGKESHDPNNDDAADIKAIESAIELGITHIDTAEVYANGYAETLIGKAIKKYDRKNLFLVSKVGIHHLAYEDVLTAAKESLKRIKTNYLDLYLVHRYSLTIPIKDTMRAMDKLFEEGLIKNIGVSNFTVKEMHEAQAYSKHKIVATQLHLNVKFRESERKGLLDYCQKNDVMFIAWRPLQKGLFEQKGTILEEMAKKYGKTPSQIAINWLISQENVVTLSKTRSLEHLKENLGAIGWQMEKEDIERIRIEYPNQQAVSDSVPLHD